MKNTYSASQNQKFSQQLDHLQGVVGLANWNFSPSTPEQVRAYNERGHQLIARDNAAYLRSAFQGTQRFIKAKVFSLLGDFLNRRAS